MFLDWKNQYYENDYTTQSNLQIQCNAYQDSSGIFFFYRSRKKILKFIMNGKRPQIAKSNPQEEEQKAGGITHILTSR